MTPRLIYLLLSLAVSSVVFYGLLSSHGGAVQYYDQAASWLDLHRDAATNGNATVEGGLNAVEEQEQGPEADAGAGEYTYRVLANGTRIPDNLNDIFNETLGVQEVFMLGLPERRDKRDGFAVSAELTNFTYTQIDGVKPSEVDMKSLPYTMEMDENSIACWRAHMNILESMVERRVRSIMVFEDDADWDVAFKHQLIQLALGSRFLLNTPNDTVPTSPYGDGWDILWLGHCGTTSDPTDPRRWVIPDDPTTVPTAYRDEYVKPDTITWEYGPKADFSTRTVHIGGGNICTAAYVISLRGAEKLLYHMSMQPYNQPIDVGMGIMCRLKWSDFTCISPFPTIVGTYKPAGDSSRWSDLGHTEAGTVDEKGHAEKLSFSTRQNMGRLLTGQNKFESKFPDVYGELSMEEIARGRGHAEWITLPEVVEEVVDEEIVAESGK